MLTTAMETQLVQRYLRDSSCTHGLYLVGWFRCSLWDGDDGRQGDTPSYDKTHAQSLLDTQATLLSNQQGVHVRAVVIDTSLTMHADNGS